MFVKSIFIYRSFWYKSLKCFYWSRNMFYKFYQNRFISSVVKVKLRVTCYKFIIPTFVLYLTDQNGLYHFLGIQNNLFKTLYVDRTQFSCLTSSYAVITHGTMPSGARNSAETNIRLGHHTLVYCSFYNLQNKRWDIFMLWQQTFKSKAWNRKRSLRLLQRF